MTNREKYKDKEKLLDAFSKFHTLSKENGCEKCRAHHPTDRNCAHNWASLECEEETPSADARLEREKRIQDVALAFIEQCGRNVSMAFLLAEEYVAKCEQREKLIKEGGEK